MANTAADTYTQRAEKIRELLENHPEITENGFEIPDEPGRYLAIEKQSDDGVWAINADSLEEIARELEESSTLSDDEDITDLDTGRYFVAINQTVSFMCLDGQEPSKVDVTIGPKRHALSDPELATVLAALRYWQREGLMSAGCEQDIASDGGRLEPLSEGQIEALCERLNCGE